MVRLLALAAVALAAPAAPAQIVWNVTFLDPGGANAGFYAPMTSHVVAAGDDWAAQFRTVPAATIDVRVEFTSAVARATGRSETSSFVGAAGGVNVFEQGVARKLRTGFDQNGATHDVEFQFNPATRPGCSLTRTRRPGRPRSPATGPTPCR